MGIEKLARRTGPCIRYINLLFGNMFLSCNSDATVLACSVVFVLLYELHQDSH